MKKKMETQSLVAVSEDFSTGHRGGISKMSLSALLCKTCDSDIRVEFPWCPWIRYRANQNGSRIKELNKEVGPKLSARPLQARLKIGQTGHCHSQRQRQCRL